MPAVHSFLVTRAIRSRGVPYVGCMGPSVVVGLTAVGALVGRQALPCVVDAGLLMGEAESQHDWLHGLGNPRILVAWWWPGLNPGMTGCGDWGPQDWCWLAGGWVSPQC